MGTEDVPARAQTSDGMGKEEGPARAKVPAAGQASAARYVALHRACVHLAIVCVGVPANALRERDTSWRICRLARHRALMGISGGSPVAVPTAAAVVPGESDHTAETSLSKTPLIALPSQPRPPPGEGAARSGDEESAAKAGGSALPNSSRKQKTEKNTKLPVGAAPFSLDAAVTAFNPSSSAAGSANGASTSSKGRGGKGKAHGETTAAVAVGEATQAGDGGCGGVQHVCSVCKEVFPSKTKLFAHIKEAGHRGKPADKKREGKARATADPSGEAAVAGCDAGVVLAAAEVPGTAAGPQAEGRQRKPKKEKKGEDTGRQGGASAVPDVEEEPKKKKGAKERAGPEQKGGAEKGERPEPQAKGKKKGGAWWRTLQEDDPISLEPLNKLHYAPFDLKANDDISVWFDPRILGNYLVSTAAFEHPLSRRPLTRGDCQALDQHLAACRLKAIGVTEVTPRPLCVDVGQKPPARNSPAHLRTVLPEAARRPMIALTLLHQ